jgi:hypothetical protein
MDLNEIFENVQIISDEVICIYNDKQAMFVCKPFIKFIYEKRFEEMSEFTFFLTERDQLTMKLEPSAVNRIAQWYTPLVAVG